MTLLGALSSFDRNSMVFAKTLLAILSLIVSVLMVVEVVMRFIFQSPVFGLEEITLIFMMWLYMLGAIVASQRRSHLSAEMINLLIKSTRGIAVVRALATFLTLVVAVFALVWSYDLFAWGLEKRQGTPVFGIPWVVSQSSIFLASILFVVYLIRDFIRDVGSLFESFHVPLKSS